MDDLISEFDHGRRTVTDGHVHDQPAHTVELRRWLRAPVADVWDACTDPDRVRRWFLPLTGDLRSGGHFQLEGNASGTIHACQPPHRLQVGWECGDQASMVSLELETGEDDGSTELVLCHTVPDDAHWTEYGPGAVGVGWDLPLAALAVLTSGGNLPASDEIMADPRTPELMRRSAAAWGDAHQSSGASPKTARDAAANTSAFFAPDEQPSAQ